MAETLVKNPVCSSCGSDARPQALFCYHCGGPLQTEEFSENENPDEPSDVWFRGDIADDSKVSETSETIEDNKIIEQRSEKVKDVNEDVNEEESLELQESEKELERELKEVPEKEENHKFQEKLKTVENDSESDFLKDSNLKSAADLRNREKPTRLKKVEIVWEEHDNSPNFLFIVFALLLTLLVAVLIFIAFYLK